MVVTSFFQALMPLSESLTKERAVSKSPRRSVHLADELPTAVLSARLALTCADICVRERYCRKWPSAIRCNWYELPRPLGSAGARIADRHPVGARPHGCWEINVGDAEKVPRSHDCFATVPVTNIPDARDCAAGAAARD